MTSHCNSKKILNIGFANPIFMLVVLREGLPNAKISFSNEVIEIDYLPLQRTTRRIPLSDGVIRQQQKYEKCRDNAMIY